MSSMAGSIRSTLVPVLYTWDPLRNRHELQNSSHIFLRLPCGGPALSSAATDDCSEKRGMGLALSSRGLGVWVFRVWGLGFRVWGLGFRV